MHESPSSAELLKAVMGFLSDVAMPNLTGHAQFSARVSANALALVLREIEGRAVLDQTARQLYADLLSDDQNSDLADLEARLCAAIAQGDLNAETPALLATLRQVAHAQLAIDQPNYSGLAP
jgi:hypothetical protein